ncbi:LolA family protein [Fodinibius halophilus]|uniref:Outer membrane lipoprotein carrier protein LolA n=1 Tax=Fodinibius halophilus TaxID=1736908 RepID=A0A6M1T3P8_9BACT|nr:outer membrane lipoprotein carrier protein LolA [Fodinibius halophilus]NGP87263.1 outer membrane lipoprotein carrier protein LolA [Fodinibius halophilus]
MIWTSLNDNIFRFLFAVWFLAGYSVIVNAQNTHFDKLKQKFERGEVFKAAFNHESIDSYTQDTVSSQGKIWVGQQRYKIRGSNQTVVVDGQTSRVYDDRRNRLIISKYEPQEDDFAPSRILNGIDSTFAIKTQQKRNNQIYIQLVSDDPFAIYKKVEIYLSEALIPQKIRAVDPVDNIITTRFQNGKFMEPQKGLFVLEYPQEAEVVDMRN